MPVLGQLVHLNFFAALLVALLLSPGMMYVLALVLERRVLWPREQYYGFLYGDIALAFGVACVASLASKMTPSALWPRTWHYAAFLLAVALGAGLWAKEDKYSKAIKFSPTKIWHNTVLYAALGYWLLGLGLPVLWKYKFGSPLTWGLLASLMVWAVLNGTEHHRPGVRKAHVAFNWRRMRPS